MKRTKPSNAPPKTPAPPLLVGLLAATMPETPSMAVRDAERQIPTPFDIPYTMHTDPGLARTDSKYLARTHADVEAAQIRTPDPGLGLSLRMRMP